MAQFDSNELTNLLKEIQETPGMFLSVPVQTFDFCVAALRSADDKDWMLRFIDPELRTAALLKAAGVDVEAVIGFDDEEYVFEYQGDEYWSPGNDEGAVYYLYGTCDGGDLEAAQKILRRYLEDCKDTWEDIWNGNPLDADSYVLQFSPDKKYFKMTFGFDREYSMECFHDAILNAVWDNPYLTQYAIKLFYYANFYTSFDMGCEYYAESMDEDGGLDEEHERWNFNVGDFDEVHEVHGSYMYVIEKRLALWLVEDGGDEEAIEQAKKDLAAARERAENT